MNIDNEGHILRWNGHSNGFCKILCSTHLQRQLHNEETAGHTVSIEDITHCLFELDIVERNAEKGENNGLSCYLTEII